MSFKDYGKKDANPDSFLSGGANRLFRISRALAEEKASR